MNPVGPQSNQTNTSQSNQGGNNSGGGLKGVFNPQKKGPSDIDSYLADHEAQFDKAVKDKSNRYSSQNLLKFAEIRDGLVIMNDGSFRAVVKAKSINYDLMSIAEQESVEYAYQSFLNSLYFNVQILVRSRKIDMGPYLEKLAKIRGETDNMLLGLLMEDYIYFISNLVSQTNIMSKEFYVVVPLVPGEDDRTKDKNVTATAFSKLFKKESHGPIRMDEEKLEKSKVELRNRVQGVVNGLLQMGVTAAPLSTSELIELFYNYYNPDTATRQTLLDMESLSSPVVSKGEGSARQVHLEKASEQ
ncbi:MAG: hypothetical protein H6799_03640 [Candidatus Nomurabacteria bacterium]|nr:MAG: hypothetical protein H6799_03640 [Candidatus Nomurabacteria bacterium]